MYRPDSEGRLQIPDELLDMLSYEIKNVTCAICLSRKNETYILPMEKLSPNDKVLTTRLIDKKGRIFTKSIASFWGNPKEYLIYFQKGKIWIKGII